MTLATKELDRLAGLHADLGTPVVPPDLAARNRMRYIELATQILKDPAIAERDLTLASLRHLSVEPNAAIRIRTLGGQNVYPAFQFDRIGRVNRLIGISSLHLGTGIERAEWWVSSNESLGGVIPASLVGTDRERNGDLLTAINALPLRQQRSSIPAPQE